MSQTKSPSKRTAFGTVSDISLGILGWIFVFLPVFFTFTFPFFIVQKVHHLLAKIFRKDLIPLTNPIDCMIALKPTSENPMNNGCQVWRLKGQLNLRDLRDHFQKLFLSTPELRESYRNLYCYFEQWGLYMFKKRVDSLNLEEMIQELHWNYGKEEKETDEEALDGFIGKWMSTADYGKSPCWRILIVQLDKTKESIFLLKFNHGLADGYSYCHVVEKLSGIKTPYIVKKHDFTISTKIKYILTFPFLTMNFCYHLWLKRPLPLPNHTPSVKSTLDSQWMISFVTLDLDKVKKVRQLTNSHFNTVLAAIQVGAVRRYCLEFAKEEAFPENCYLPFAFGWPNHPAMTEGTICNHLTLTGIYIPFKDPNPLHRLLESEADYLYNYDVGLGVVCHWLFFKFLLPTPPKITLLLVDFLTRIKMYAIEQYLSPLILSGEKYQLLGIPCEELTLPVHVPGIFRPMQMYVIPVTNSGKLDISVNATDKIFKSQKDFDRFTKIYFREELDSLLNAAGTEEIVVQK